MVELDFLTSSYGSYCKTTLLICSLGTRAIKRSSPRHLAKCLWKAEEIMGMKATMAEEDGGKRKNEIPNTERLYNISLMSKI